MNLNLQGRNALVCGSTQGLGLAVAKELALLGANVTLMARNEEKLKLAKEELHQSENQCHGYLVADFSDYHQSRQSLLQEGGGGFKLNLRSTIDDDYNGTLPQISIIDLKSRNDSRKNQTYLNLSRLI
jgi:hypothetical protein